MNNIYHNPEYDFLKENAHLNNNIILMGVGGSHAYGTNVPTSDYDTRGIALNSPREILLGTDFEQVTNDTTDTVIYSFKKAIKLLSNCNPNTIEMLGLRPEDYSIMTDIGKDLIDNQKMFLSQIAVKSFGGYANQQLTRLRNGSTDERLEEMGIRNRKAIQHNKLGKHSMHLVRLYYMAFDILEKGEIITYREKEHDLLMRIRNGEFLKDDKPTKEFEELLDSLNKRFARAKKETILPEKPDYDSINEFVIDVHKNILEKEYSQHRTVKKTAEVER